MQTQDPVKETPRIGRASFFLFLSLLCVYLILARGRITSGDEWHIYGTTESLVERGSWRVEVEGFTRTYSRFSVFPSLLAVPLYKLAQPLARDRAGDDNRADGGPMTRRDIEHAAVSLATPFVTAATAVVLFAGLVRFGVSSGPSLTTALCYALATMALPYSSSMYTQPLAALCMACLLMSSAAGSVRLAALSLFFLLAVRIEFIVLTPLLIAYLWRFHGVGRMSLVWLVVAMACSVGLNTVVNVCRGDHALLGDYGSEGFTTPIWIGLHGVLFSPGKGLLWFSPIAAAGLLFMPWLCRTVPRVGYLVVGLTGAAFILVACWWTWHGARSWGPRLLLPVMPVLVLPLAWLFQSWHSQLAGHRWIVAATIIVSIAVQVCGALREPVSESALSIPPLAVNENESIYMPQVGPWGVAAQNFPDLLLSRVWLQEPQWHTAELIVIAGLLVTGSLAAWLLMRAIGVPFVSLRTVLPGLSRYETAAVCGIICILLLPELVVAWPTWAQPPHDQTTGIAIPGQYKRLVFDPTGDRLVGQLFVPLSGEYILYQQGPPAMQCRLDGRPVFPPGANLHPAVIELPSGFHRMELLSAASGAFGSLYWTTPGLAHYKQPVPTVYLTGPTLSWSDRCAIVAMRSKWIAWLCVLFLCLAAFARPSPGRNATNRAES